VPVIYLTKHGRDFGSELGVGADLLFAAAHSTAGVLVGAPSASIEHVARMPGMRRSGLSGAFVDPRDSSGSARSRRCRTFS
jgi:hypothetical protein